MILAEVIQISVQWDKLLGQQIAHAHNHHISPHRLVLNM